MRTRRRTVSLVDWGAASKPATPGASSGDRCLVKRVPGGLLAAVVDGVGCGEPAAAAARVAVRTLERRAGDSLPAMLSGCDAALTRTRGAVMSLALLGEESRTLSWLSVGNVSGVLLRGVRGPGPPLRRYVLQTPGVVGYRFSAPLTTSVALEPLDTVILATDGIAPGFEEDLEPRGEPQRLADGILSRHARGRDDALVLVLRWRGAVRE